MLSGFQDLMDVKVFMRGIAEKLPAHSPYKADFDFFSAINYTTQSEYRQELKSFWKLSFLELQYLPCLIQSKRLILN